MADRNCKVFSPNYFNPTKCQNCFKSKEQHLQDYQIGKQPLSARRSAPLKRNTPPAKTVLKESILLKGLPEQSEQAPEKWEKNWFRLYSNGELQEFSIAGGQINKNTVTNTVMLQEFIRMLDGKSEISEDLCFGVKTLRDTLYFKTLTRVDYENWWKEFSSFVAAPIRMIHQDSVSSPKTGRGYTRPNYQKQHSSPAAVLLGKSTSRHSRSSSSSSTLTDSDPAEMETLRNQVSKLEEDNTKLSKIEEERRKLELEVNYWKEYVTNAQALKRTGVSVDTTTELADTRNKLIQCQDELNETQKRLKLNSGKLLMQNRELNDSKTKLQEANSLVAVYKARIDQMSKEMSTLKDSPTSESSSSDKEKLLLTTKSPEDIFFTAPKTNDFTPPVNSPSPEVMGAQHFEDKFLVLKDRMKRIEKELFLKSKELEKANESRSKVAKYTRSLLQELETRLSDTQHKLSEREEQLNHANTELKMERQRRIQLEDGPRRRMSSVASPPKNVIALEQLSEAAISDNETPQSSDLTEHDADTKYADYYRARFKETEEALLEKDKKLHQAEEKIKQIQTSMKSNSESYKVINELQAKLSDATHKLSDRQLKNHELTREIDRLKGYEKTFQKKTQQCNTLEEIVKDLEKTNLDQSQNLHQVKQDLELLKIREVVLKEQLQTLIEESDDEDDDDDDGNHDDDAKLGKSIALKNQINNMVELETQVKKLTLDNEKLLIENSDLETRIRKANIQHFKTIESGKNFPSSESGEKVDNDVKIKELESKLLASEDKHCSEMSSMKEKHFDDLSAMEKKFMEETKELNELLANFKTENEGYTRTKADIDGECNELRGKVMMLNLKIEDFESKLQVETNARENAENLLVERSNVVKKVEERCKRITVERDALKEATNGSPRNSYGVYDDDSVEGDEKVSQLTTENHEMKVKIRQLERKLRVSLERYEDIVASMKEKGIYSEGKDKDRDSGIVITQEIKNLMDSFKKEDSLESMAEGNLDIGNIVNNLQIGIDSESGLERYKKLSANLTYVLKDLGKKFMTSEQRNIELAMEVEKRTDAEEEHVSKYTSLLGRVEDLNQQILELQEVLQSKADELERERKNVLNLVEVTSAYIKELEGSLTESKTKIQELQAIAESPNKQESGRQPPDGSAVEGGLDNLDGLAGSKPKNEDVTCNIQEKLNAKIITLESNISEIKESHANEIRLIRSQSQHALDQLQHGSTGEETEELLAKIESLEEELEEQQQNYDKDVAMLTQRFQTELKAAFGNDAGSMDMLQRVQELEIEVEQTRKDRDAKLKEVVEQCEKEKQQMKDDMATVLQASLAATMGGEFNSSSSASELGDTSATNLEDLQDRVIKLEQELMDQQDRYEEELQMEKKAHQTEMEDTIRDMMMVRAATTTNHEEKQSADESDTDQNEDSIIECRLGSRVSIDQGSKKAYSEADVDAIKAEYEKKIEQKMEEHQDALDQVRQDMAIVISSLKQGSSSDTIMELQAKMKDLEQELEDTKNDYEDQLEELELKFKRSESKNFFALRRNEEMGGKIYQMQNELEELDRKHSLEIQIYQEKLSSLGGGDIDTKALEYVKVNAELEDKVRAMELALNTLRNERDGEMDTFEMSLREEKRAAVEEMTDKVLKLESIIDDMKENHEKEILAYEKLLHSQKNEAGLKVSKRIEELEATIRKLTIDNEKEIDELAQEHKKVAEELRLFYEKEIGDIKKRSSSDMEGGARKQSVDQSTYLKQVTKDLKEKHEKEITALKLLFSNEKQEIEARQQKEIDDIRMQYDEKLKLGYKEGLRRQSLSDRKSDGTRMRELIAQKEQVETKYLELEIKHENDLKTLETKNIKLQSLISELKNRLNGDTTDSPYKRRDVSSESDRFSPMDDDESQKKLKEIQEQIERYERRIEYYQEKSQREKTEESHRVSELQSEIVELHKEMNNIKENRRKEVYDKEKKEKIPSEKMSLRRNTDGSVPARRHTDTEAAKPVTRPRDPRKRWSNLEERTEKEEGKSGTVSARKSMWESILDEPSGPTTRTAKMQLSKPPSGVR